MDRRLRTLYINADADLPQCSIYEAGVGLLEAFEISSTMDVTYAALGMNHEIPSPNWINKEFDLVVFNYHFHTMRFLPYTWASAITKPKFGITFDAHPNQVWEVQSHWGKLTEFFDYMAFPDPTLEVYDDRTLRLPRLISRYNFQRRSINVDTPIISMFGLHSYWKDLGLVVELLNKEFDNATLRMKFSSPDQSEGDYTAELQHIMKNISKKLKPSIKVEYSTDFMTIENLVYWLNKSDLNIFFYQKARDDVGAHIPCSLDQGVSAQRPMAVTDVMTLRHTKPYLTPYPQHSLREAMEYSLDGVLKMYNDWSPEHFIQSIDSFLMEKEELWISL